MKDPAELYHALLKSMRGGDAKAHELFHPDFTAYEDPGMPYGGVVRGGRNFLSLRQKVYDFWEPGFLNLQYVCGDGQGGHASAHFKLVGRPKGAGEQVEGYVIVTWTFRDGLAYEARVFYFDTPALSRALEAGNVSMIAQERGCGMVLSQAELLAETRCQIFEGLR